MLRRIRICELCLLKAGSSFLAGKRGQRLAFPCARASKFEGSGGLCGAAEPGCPFALDTACARSPLLYLGSGTRSCAGLSLLCPVAGDSACSIPPQTIPQQCLDVIRDWTPKIAKELKVIGLINIQYAIQDNQVC